MSRRAALTCSMLGVLLIVPTLASAASLRWLGRGGDWRLDSQQAVRCTLIVTRDSLLGDIDGFRILWSGDGRLRFDSEVDQSRIAYHADRAPTLRERAEAVSGRESLDLGTRTRSSEQYYFITVLSGSAFTITAVEEKAGRPLSWPLGKLGSVTINGGFGQLTRPELFSLNMRAGADSLRFTAAGLGLSAASRVLLARVAGGSIDIAFTTVGDTAIRAACATSDARGGRFVSVIDSKGVGTQIEADVNAVVPASAPRQILAILDDSAHESVLSGVTGIASMMAMGSSQQARGQNDPSSQLEDMSKVLVVDIAPGHTTAATLGKIRSNPSVLMADSLSEGPESLFDPNDLLWGEQWGLHENTGAHCNGMIVPSNGSSINLPAAWDFAPYPPIVRIGIIDSGIDYQHPETNFYDPDEVGVSYAPFDSDPYTDVENHGTAVASIAAARTNNGVGLAGASKFGEPVSIKWQGIDAETNQRTGGWPSLTACINYVKNRPNLSIVNISAGGKFISPSEKQALIKACKNAFIGGHLLVASAGNSNDSGFTWPAADNNHVLAVGATLWNNQYWTSHNAWDLSSDSTTGSSFGSWLDLMAPGGVGIAAAWGTGGAFYWNLDHKGFSQPPCVLSSYSLATPASGITGFGGTSASAPLVSGVAAWLKKIQPTLTGEDLGQVMQRTATDMGANGFDVRFGHGLLNAAAAAAFVSHPNWIEHGRIGAGGTVALTVLDSLVGTTITLTNAGNITNGTYPCVRYHLRGAAPLVSGFLTTPTLWVRRSTTLGLPAVSTWDDDTGAPWGEVAALSPSAVTLGTYVYRLTSLNNRFYPTNLDSARVDYTAVGPSGTLSASAPGNSPELTVRTLTSPARTRARFAITGLAPGALRVEVFDVGGRRLSTLFEGTNVDANTSLEWDGRALGGGTVSPGMYICRIEQPGRRTACRFALIR